MNSYWLRKLVHDETVKCMEGTGAKVRYRNLNDEEFIEALDRKFVDEAQEIGVTVNRDQKINELSDILEVIHAYREAFDITMEELEAFLAKKTETRGSYSKKVYVDYIETPEGSQFDKYCKVDPEKYPVKET